jgi:hypothetical protein
LALERYRIGFDRDLPFVRRLGTGGDGFSHKMYSLGSEVTVRGGQVDSSTAPAEGAC